MQSYTTAELILQQPVLEGTVPSSLILLSPLTLPTISLTPDSPGNGNYLFKAKTAENHVALFTFCLFCLPAWEKPQEDKIQGKKKQNQKHLSLATRSILLHIQSAIWPLQVFKKKINQTGAPPDLSWHSHLTNTKITLMPACSLSKVSGGPLLLCQEIFYGNARMWKVFLLWSAYSLT